MVEFERKKLLAYAKRILPHLTSDDILQPQDFPELENNAEFRYLEGVVIGLETALAALYAGQKQSCEQSWEGFHIAVDE